MGEDRRWGQVHTGLVHVSPSVGKTPTVTRNPSCPCVRYCTVGGLCRERTRSDETVLSREEKELDFRQRNHKGELRVHNRESRCASARRVNRDTGKKGR